MSTPLQKKLEKYLALREAMGFQTIKARQVLRKFCQYLGKHCNGKSIRAELSIDWVCKVPNRKANTQAQRLSLLRGFLIHLSATMPGVEIPSLRMLPTPRRALPFVFTCEQIERLLRETRLERNPRCNIDPYVAQTLFGLMASTGLRPSESRNLLISDVFLKQNPPRLLIRDTKFSKTRWVPIHSSVAIRLSTYLRWRRRTPNGNQSEYFFVSKLGKQLHHKALERYFNGCVARLKFESRPGQLAPSLHSLRHSFTVQRLRRWYQDGADIHALLPNLSVYLGHSSLSSTYWYLSSTPDLMNAASKNFKNYADGGII